MAMSDAEPKLMSVESASQAFSFLEPYLPPTRPVTDNYKIYPHLTLTYASSLDGAIALKPGAQTALSGPLSKAMTHYLRSRHDAILIGAGTAIVDDPALNCRLEGVGYLNQPRPVVLDPRGSWSVSAESRVVLKAWEGSGKGVWVLYDEERIDEYPAEMKEAVREGKGRLIPVPLVWMKETQSREVLLEDLMIVLAEEGIRSVMVEGGAKVINDLLRPECQHFVNSVVITIAPVFLGKGSVTVSPEQEVDDCETGKIIQPMTSLKDVTWRDLERDVVMCGRFG